MTTSQRNRPLAVVSGGGTGIGFASALQLARDGFDLAIIGRRREVLDDAAARITADQPEAHVQTIAADLQDPEAVTQVSRELEGPVAVLLNSAGGNVVDRGDGLRGIAANYESNFKLNVLTAVLLTEALLPKIARPGGRIITISSIAGLRGADGYGAAKAALHGWSMGLALQVAADQITVNAIAPGYVPDTEFWDGRRSEDIVSSRLAQIPMGRAGTPQEVAGVVSYLAGPAGGWTTGQIVQVNGGALLGRG